MSRHYTQQEINDRQYHNKLHKKIREFQIEGSHEHLNKHDLTGLILFLGIGLVCIIIAFIKGV